MHAAKNAAHDSLSVSGVSDIIDSEQHHKLHASIMSRKNVLKAVNQLKAIAFSVKNRLS